MADVWAAVGGVMRVAALALPLLAACATQPPDAGIRPNVLAAETRVIAAALGMPPPLILVTLDILPPGRLAEARTAHVRLDRHHWPRLSPPERQRWWAHEVGHVLARGDGDAGRLAMVRRLTERAGVSGVTRYAAAGPDEAVAECLVVVVLREGSDDARARCGALWRWIARLGEAGL